MLMTQDCVVIGAGDRSNNDDWDEKWWDEIGAL